MAVARMVDAAISAAIAGRGLQVSITGYAYKGGVFGVEEAQSSKRPRDYADSPSITVD